MNLQVNRYFRYGLPDVKPHFWALALILFFTNARTHLAVAQRLLFPIEPGKQASITGNMGELRTNHFHGGLDIRTGYRTGLPVFASADGYICYVQISSYGYGNMLHVRHSNGLVTVYAHLEKFAPEVEAYARDAQRTQANYEVELYPKRNVYKVRQGDILGYSGNSGSSGGPHLHYEVRDSNDVVLNPLHYGFAEVVDKLAPYVSGLAVSTFGIESRAAGMLGRARIPVKAMSRNTYTAGVIPVYGTIGLQILARDRINNGTQHTGIACMELSVDGKDVFYLNIEHFPFNETGNINIHIDYETFRETGDRFQKCYVDDGNSMLIGRGEHKGIINITDSLDHPFILTLYDAYKNKCELRGILRGVRPLIAKAVKYVAKPEVKTEIYQNLLKVTASGPKAFMDSIFAYHAGSAVDNNGGYVTSTGKQVLLYDLRRHLIDSVGYGQSYSKTDIVAQIPSGKSHWQRLDGADVYFRSASLFDTLYLQKRYVGPDLIDIGDPDIPLFTPIIIKVPKPLAYKPTKAWYLLSGGKAKWLKTDAIGKDSIQFETKYFGQYKLLADSLPPTVRVIQQSRAGFRALVGDNLSGLSWFGATLNGQQLALNYDHKRNLVWIDADELDLAGPGKLEFTIRDNCGNEKRATCTIL